MKKVMLALLATTAVVSATAQTFDFESMSVGSGLTSLTDTQGGLTMSLTRTSGATFGLISSFGFFPASWGDVVLDPFDDFSFPDDYFVADFSSSIFSFSIDMGDFGADVDDIVLEAYDGLGGTGNLLASTTISGYAGNVGNGEFETATVSSLTGAIMSVKFRGGDGAEFYNSLYMDNITVEAVPEPATMAVLGLGAAALLRRKRNA